MNKFSLSLLCVMLLTNIFGRAQAPKRSIVHIGLVYPISTNGLQAAQFSNPISVHAIAGLSKDETGLAVAGFALLVKDSATGVQLSGFLNAIGKKATGLQAAGFLNLTGSSEGLSLAGFANISRDSAGEQVAGF